MAESIDLTPKESRRLINLVIRDHKQAEAKRDRLLACNDLNALRRTLVEAGIPQRDVDQTLDRFRRRLERRRRARQRRPLLLGALLVVVGLVGYYGAAWVAPRYDVLVGQREDVRREWAQVDALLQRRYDLIPNLVETTRGYVIHEGGVLTDIAAAHAGYVRAQTPDARMQASYTAERGIRTFALLGARYPELKADRTFARLMDELVRAEDQLTAQRMKYNDAVRELNTGLQTTEGRVVGAVTSLELASYYEPPSTVEALPLVKFDGPAAATTTPSPSAGEAAAEEVGAESPADAVESHDPLEAIVVTAIQSARRRRRATLRFPNGATRVIKMGERLPGFDARVVGINPRSVQLEGSSIDPSGRTVRRTVRLPLRPG